MHVGVQIHITSQKTFIPSASDKERAPLAEGNWLHNFLRKAGFCAIARIWGASSDRTRSFYSFLSKEATPWSSWVVMITG